MKIIVKNVARILEAEVILDGVTTIAGYNDMGKSTILKAAYIILNTFHNVNDKIMDARKRSIMTYFRKQETYFDENGYEHLPFNILLEITNKVCEYLPHFVGDKRENYILFKRIFLDSFDNYKDYLTDNTDKTEIFSDEFLMPIYEGFKKICSREKKEDIKYIGDMYIRNVFKNQANNLRVKNDAFINIVLDSEQCLMTIKDNKISDMEYSQNMEADIFYLPAYNLLDIIGMSLIDRRIYSPEYDIRKALSENDEEPVFEEYQETENNIRLIRDILEEVISGKLETLPSGQISFKEDSLNEPVNIGNVASGMKNFLIIQSLVERGKLKKNSILLIDEPETNLHPEWHLKFAEILVLMYKYMGVRSIVNSHSPYFIRALEVKMADHGIKDKGHYYLMEEADKNLFKTQDVTGATDKIYELLYRPLEYL